MKYAVTGACGFLGTNLCLRLLSEGHEVLGLDNLSTGTKRNLRLLQKNRGFSFKNHDIVKPLPSLQGAAFIYNLACPASPPKYQKDAIQTFRTSVWGVWNVIEAAEKSRIPILHASTSEVYGDPLVHPQKEGYWGNVNPIGVRACYDEGKRGAESLLMDYFRSSKNPVKIVRIFNTYGPHMDPKDGRVISNFLTQALAGKELTVYGDGKQTRSFCFVDDLIDGMRLMEDGPADFCGPVNLGNPQEFTMLQLAKAVEEAVGRKLRVLHLPLPQDDPVRRMPDISLAKERLGWSPKTPLAAGLAATAEYFSSLKN